MQVVIGQGDSQGLALTELEVGTTASILLSVGWRYVVRSYCSVLRIEFVRAENDSA